MSGTASPPSGRRAALDILETIDSGRGHSNTLLAELPLGMAERERALATELVYGVLRRRLALDRSIHECSRRPLTSLTAPLLTALRLTLYQILFLTRIPPAAAVDEGVRMVRERLGQGAAAYANGVLRGLCRRLGQGDMVKEDLPDPARRAAAHLAAKHSYPRFLVERYLDRLGFAECEALLETMNRPAPVVLRPSSKAGGMEALARRLRAEGVSTAPSPILPGTLRASGGAPQRSEAFREGLFYIQDEASQIVARLLPPGPGDTLDLCAAPGGKALQLAEEAAPGTRVIAADRSRERLSLLMRNTARLGVHNLRAIAMDARMPALRTRVARLLVDAPCSGTGIIRRHPEIRWRRKPADIARFARAQALILRAAADLLAPGGMMVYAVCSLEPEEGIERVRGLLRQHPELKALDARRLLPGGLHHLIDPAGFLVTLPHRHDIDGFFAAVIQADRSAGALA